jgi:hypothetical protein
VLYSALSILFRVLKVMRLQDTIGERPQARYLLAVACVAVANQSYSNIGNRRPLFMKNLLKATFMAMNFAEIDQVYENP